MAASPVRINTPWTRKSPIGAAASALIDPPSFIAVLIGPRAASLEDGWAGVISIIHSSLKVNSFPNPLIIVMGGHEKLVGGTESDALLAQSGRR
jgi:hypothetical protein